MGLVLTLKRNTERERESRKRGKGRSNEKHFMGGNWWKIVSPEVLRHCPIVIR
jgi:hypothetical protein